MQTNQNLTNCPDCGNACSKNAMTCPKCGNTIKTNPTNLLSYIILSIGGLLVFFYILGKI